jgi:hypothetical protein
VVGPGWYYGAAVIGMVVCVAELFVFPVVLVTLRVHWLAVACLRSVYWALILCFAKVFFTDPGILPRYRSESDYCTATTAGLCWKKAKYCRLASSFVPAGARYDDDVSCVVEGADHYCPYVIGTYIGRRNYYSFLATVVLGFFSSATVVWLSFTFVLHTTVCSHWTSTKMVTLALSPWLNPVTVTPIANETVTGFCFQSWLISA